MVNLSGGRTSRAANWLVAVVLVAVPFQAFLTVWGSTLVGHYTALRLWDDVLLLALLAICCWWLIRDSALRTWFGRSLLVQLILTYSGLTILLGIVSLLKHDVTAKALAYGLLINLRFLAWFLAVLLTAQRSAWLRQMWPKLLLIPAAIVVIFAGLQFTVLPHNFLSHFGYNAATTVTPIETINHNTHYIRVQSTLRGANPLGAYLVVILSALGVLYTRGNKKRICAIFGLVTLIALYASGSRSAWVGTLLSLLIIVWSQLKTLRLKKIFVAAAATVLLVGGSAAYVLRNNVGLENTLLHTQKHSAVTTGSNSAHAGATLNGLKDVVRQPFGDGPGTAGPASVYNHGRPARIAEDYYIQIAQETGWLGLVLFIGILGLVGLELYRQIGTSRLGLALFASLIGLTFVNFLSHAWADDTLAYVWWGLAGIALGKPQKKSRTGQHV